MEQVRVPPWLKQSSGTSSMISPLEYERQKAERINSMAGSLTGYDCEACKNRGYFRRVDDLGRPYNQLCKCAKIRHSLELIRRSGMADLTERYTLERWKTPESWHRQAQQLALEYAQEPNGKWFFMAGPPGTGKSHLCTALCLELLRKGMETRYMLWRDTSVQAKACVNDAEAYKRLVDPLKQVQVLYIDDFLKTGKGIDATTGDLNLAFEILNSRYADSKKLTVLSSERNIEQILSMDEAVGSRIYERTKGYYIPLTGAKNWRLKP